MARHRRKRRVPRRGLKRYLVVTGFAAVAFVALGVLYLDFVVTRQFVGRRWTLPAQVYAQPLELYAGLEMSPDGLERELKRLGYQRVEKPERAGSYRRRGNRIDVAARQARFADEVREPTALSIVASGRAVQGLYDSQGRAVPIFRLDPLLIGSIFPIHGEDRVVLAPEEVPPLLPAALKVVEDRKFDTHHGVDPEAIVRALWANLRAGQIEQGGSTLTQQLVKSYFLDNRQTLWRKIREAIMAMLLEARFEKADLMNAYINEIYLGQDGRRAVHGFGLASQFYFGKPLAELDLAEVALLVAVVRGPSYYDPRRHPERALVRRDLVLRLMGEFSVVAEDAAARAMRQPLGVTNQGQTAGSYYPGFLDLVRRTLRRDYRDEDLTEAGLTIFTTLDPVVQSQAELALTAELDRIEQRRDPQQRGLEGVVVVTAPQSGEVIALVSGRQTGFDGFNRALDARRPIGSLVKPIIYLSALQTGRYNAASVVEDAPVDLELPNGQRWRPDNFDHEIRGPVPLLRALTESLNLATVNLGLDTGLARVADGFVALGAEQRPLEVPAMLLGSVDLSPLEVAQIYGGLANGGFRTPLRAVRAVVDAEGQPLKSFPLEVTPVADSASVYQLDRMLVQVMERGTGRSARSRLPSGLIVAGKTGTSSDYRDSWFAGFSGSHLAVTWIGFDDNRPTGLTGASGALGVWARLMGELTTTSWDAPVPEGLEEVWIDYASGFAARPGCAEEVVLVVVPDDTELPVKPGCGEGFFDELGNRTREFLRGIIR